MIDLDLLNGRSLLGSPDTLISSFEANTGTNYYYEYVIRQAQERLKNRTEEELGYGAEYLNHLLRLANREADLKARKQLDQGAEKVYITDPIMFSVLFESLDLSDRPDFPNARPEDYFSLLAIIYALESLSALQRAEALRLSEDQPDSLSTVLISHAEDFAANRLDEARELVAFITGIEFSGIFRRKTARTANRARYREFDELREKLLVYVDHECGSLSNRKAAQVAYLKFGSEVDVVSNSDDPEQQIAKWIGDHRRAERKRLGD